jgi:hypothetical protein
MSNSGNTPAGQPEGPDTFAEELYGMTLALHDVRLRVAFLSGALEDIWRKHLAICHVASRRGLVPASFDLVNGEGAPEPTA